MNVQGELPIVPSAQYAPAPHVKTIAIVFSRPMWSDTQPNVGRASPFRMLSTMPAITRTVELMKRKFTGSPAIL